MGIGNIGAPSAEPVPINLETPTLKSNMYTTGRGGSGNMAKNNDAEEARRAQDVVAYVVFLTQTTILPSNPKMTKLDKMICTDNPPSHPRRESGNNTHVGRGGAANVFKPSAADIENAKKDNAKWESAIGDDKSEDGREGLVPGAKPAKTDAEKSKGFADRGKEWLMGKIGK